MDENGGVTLPKLGPVMVAGRDMDSIKTSLIEQYRKYLRDPAIQLTLFRRFNVSGAVTHPGAYYADPTTGLADLIAQAGGASSEGRQDRVELWRSGQRVRTIQLKAAPLTAGSLRSGDQIQVPQKSWVSRNPGIVAGTLTAVAGIVVTLLAR